VSYKKHAYKCLFLLTEVSSHLQTLAASESPQEANCTGFSTTPAVRLVGEAQDTARRFQIHAISNVMQMNTWLV